MIAFLPRNNVVLDFLPLAIYSNLIQSKTVERSQNPCQESIKKRMLLEFNQVMVCLMGTNEI